MVADPIKEAAGLVGGQAALARLVGVRQQQVWSWANGLRMIPADRSVAAERATGGRVTVEQLRPDVRWARVPDAQWPHPEGRPCIDVAAPLALSSAGAPGAEAGRLQQEVLA